MEIRDSYDASSRYEAFTFESMSRCSPVFSESGGRNTYLEGFGPGGAPG